MKTKKVNRYYCDHCKKSGCSARHMKKHETGCTLNPNRICGYCRISEIEQMEMKRLLDVLPCPPTEIEDEYGWIGYGDIPDIEIAIDKLRELTQNCPMCIFSALRQKDIPIYMTKFNYKEDTDVFWNNFNDANSGGV